MRNSSGGDARLCSDFVRAPVGEPWSGFWSENGAGGNGNPSREWRSQQTTTAHTHTGRSV
jgi:hypothetical protein